MHVSLPFCFPAWCLRERVSPYYKSGQSRLADNSEALHAGVLALIDRNFQGFGKELFTDAGKYVIHFGQAPQEAAEQVERHPNTEDAALIYSYRQAWVDLTALRGGSCL